MNKVLLSLAFVLIPFCASAYSIDSVHDCVLRSKADGSNTMAIAVQCAGVGDVDVLRQCVDEVRHLDGFNMPDTAQVCSGVKDVKALRDCLKREKTEDGFTFAEVLVLCSQKGTN